MSRNIQILLFLILTQCDKLQQQITHSLDEFQTTGFNKPKSKKMI